MLRPGLKIQPEPKANESAKKIIPWLIFILACILTASALTLIVPENRVWESFSSGYDSAPRHRLRAEYSGATADALALTAREGSPGAFRRAAEAAERFCLPYLLGRRIDFAHIQQFVEDKIQKSGAYTRKYHFPPNVREEWI